MFFYLYFIKVTKVTWQNVKDSTAINNSFEFIVSKTKLITHFVLFPPFFPIFTHFNPTQPPYYPPSPKFTYLQSTPATSNYLPLTSIHLTPTLQSPTPASNLLPNHHTTYNDTYTIFYSTLLCKNQKNAKYKTLKNQL